MTMKFPALGAALIAAIVGLTSLTPVHAAPVGTSGMAQQSEAVLLIQYNSENRPRWDKRRNRHHRAEERRHDRRGHWNGHRGSREHRRGYRRHSDGYYYPRALFRIQIN